ncbi:MAG TPA: hypothetical protein VJL60_03040 [Gammaproteobacteria bacterium]|nr:hypothetical protein [Gammaproteobacteria bacterium]
MKNNEQLTLKGHAKFTVRDAETGEIKRVQEYDNIICTVGKTMIANNLTDASPDNAMRVNYSALGTNVAVPDASDTQLGTETYRNAIASETSSGAVAYLTAFYSAAECNGTYKEFGLFSNGTASANSGILLSHIAINVTKSVLETLTIDYTITVS